MEYSLSPSLYWLHSYPGSWDGKLRRKWGSCRRPGREIYFITGWCWDYFLLTQSHGTSSLDCSSPRLTNLFATPSASQFFSAVLLEKRKKVFLLTPAQKGNAGITAAALGRWQRCRVGVWHRSESSLATPREGHYCHGRFCKIKAL